MNTPPLDAGASTLVRLVLMDMDMEKAGSLQWSDATGSGSDVTKQLMKQNNQHLFQANHLVINNFFVALFMPFNFEYKRLGTALHNGAPHNAQLTHP